MEAAHRRMDSRDKAVHAKAIRAMEAIAVLEILAIKRTAISADRASMGRLAVLESPRRSWWAGCRSDAWSGPKTSPPWPFTS